MTRMIVIAKSPDFACGTPSLQDSIGEKVFARQEVQQAEQDRSRQEPAEPRVLRLGQLVFERLAFIFSPFIFRQLFPNPNSAGKK